MRKILKLAVREYNAALRTKATVIMVVLMPILMGSGVIAMKLLEHQVDTSDRRIAVVDHSGVIASFLVQAAQERNQAEIRDSATGKQIQPAYIIEPVPPRDDAPDAQRLELSNRVRHRELHAFVEIGPDVVHPGRDVASCRIEYHAENAIMDEARGWLDGVINSRLRNLRIAEAGLNEATVNRLMHPISVESLGLVSVNAATGGITQAEHSNEGLALALPMVTMMLMFLMITVGATPLINAVLEEKMQRIAEVLLGSVRPFQMMMGKLLGSVGVSLTVLAIYMGGGLVAAGYLGVLHYVPFHVLPWFLLYQIAAICLYGALFIAIGAACNDFKEAQSLMLPVWLIVMIPLFVWLNVVREPQSSFSTWMSLIPPCTPMLMLLRQTSPMGIPAWQPWAGLAGVAIFTTFCVWVAGRVFRVGILMQGKTPKLVDLVRWAVRG
jgi:ABC-2 type transport system permease protein